MDDDYLLALQLQEEFNQELGNSDGKNDSNVTLSTSGNFPIPATKTVKETFISNNSLADPMAIISKPMSLVDPQWEILDPVPDARSMFLEFNDKYFWGRLAAVEVRWSPRMTLCAGLCVYEGKARGFCSIRLSEPLLKLRPRKDLVETLLHEMIHAYLFVTDNNKDHDGHGPEFQKHMRRLNEETGTNISIYHNFHDEVDHYKQHCWKCDGPCQKTPPYYGMVKRATNRAPSPNDFWWSSHQKICGGTYHKVKEPEGYGQKKKKEKETKLPEKPKDTVDIRTMFGTKNKTSDVTATITKPTKPGWNGNKDYNPTFKEKVSNLGKKNSGGPSNVFTMKDNVPDINPETNSGPANVFTIKDEVTGFKRKDSDADKKSVVSGSSNEVVLFTGEGKTLGTSNNIDVRNRRIPGLFEPGQNLLVNYKPKPANAFSKSDIEITQGYLKTGDFPDVMPHVTDISDDEIILAADNPQTKDVEVSESNKMPLLVLSSDDSDSDSILSPNKQESTPEKINTLPQFKRNKKGSVCNAKNKKRAFNDRKSDVDSDEERNKRRKFAKSKKEIGLLRNDKSLGKTGMNVYLVSDDEGDPLESRTLNGQLKQTNTSYSNKKGDSYLRINNDFSVTPVTKRTEKRENDAALNEQMCICPVCSQQVPEASINQHLDQCL